MSTAANEMRYYNTGSSLGVVGTHPGHQDGDYTYLVTHSDGERGPWIRTADLHPSPEIAETAQPAKFYSDRN